MKKTKSLASSWNAKIYFVYIPAYHRYSKDWGREHDLKQFILSSINSLNIDIIDIHKEVFLKQSDPLSLYPFRRFGHFNEKGYKLLAEAIDKNLTKNFHSD